jgi:hypothetical protein
MVDWTTERFQIGAAKLNLEELMIIGTVTTITLLWILLGLFGPADTFVPGAGLTATTP